VQYPGVARSIDSDVSNVGALIRMSGMLPKGFAIDPYLAEAARQLHEETDYLREAACLNRFRDLLAGTEGFVLPQVYDDWSTDSILSMSFVEGRPIEEASDADQPQRDLIMQRLIELTLKELTEFKLMQSDPNFANYRFDPQTGDIILLDFGATRELSAELSADYKTFLRAGMDKDYVKLEEVAVSIGFLNETITADHRRQCLDLMRLAFDALRVPVFDFTDTTLSKDMQRGGEALARDGFIPPVVPMDVLYLQRKFGGMFLLGARLRAKLPVREIIERYLD
jgi:predicted unusual protein kinase regulating ubiquinone biosynthesis (AarF/ABC1/UbiB family)